MKNSTRVSIGTIVLGVVSVLAITGCVRSGEVSVLTGTELNRAPEEQLVWVGTGTSYRYGEDGWVRTPEQDYEFLVRQNRFADRWESLKVQNRTAAGYDGSAGEADQQHLFIIEFGELNADGELPLTVKSTYGNGWGTSDPDYERALLQINANVSRFAPYNMIRIEQDYDYEEGTLTETVLLLQVSDDGEERPFMRIREQARIFTPAER